MEKVNDPVSVCEVAEIKAGEILCRNIDGGRVALTQLPDGDIVAFDPLCPHFKGPLWAGRVHGSEVICPWHYFRFDLRTGEVARMESLMHLRRFPVSVQNGQVFVDTSSDI